MNTTKELIDALLNSRVLEFEIIPSGRTMYFNKKFILQCITELQKMELERKLDPDRSLNPLEILGLETLTNALYVELPRPPDIPVSSVTHESASTGR